MKLTINTKQLSETPAVFLRRVGYTYIFDRKTGKESYVRRLTPNFYPRFHCYLFDQGGQITFNLHLDQRPTRYEGQRAHAGEYDSPLVQNEMDRIQAAFDNQKNNNQTASDSWEQIAEKKPRKKWWPF